MQVIATAAAKGGLGKTTTATAVAYELARRGRRVLLCDMDPQAGLTLALGVGPATDPLDCPTTLDLAAVTPGLLQLRAGGRRLIGAHPQDVVELLDAVQDRIDVSVCDCAPSLSPVTVAVLGEADLALVPLSPSARDLRGVRRHCGPAPRDAASLRLRAVMVRVHRAVRLLGWEAVPVRVRASSDREKLRVAWAENMSRDGLSAGEQARTVLAVQREVESGGDPSHQRAIATERGLSLGSVNELPRIAKGVRAQRELRSPGGPASTNQPPAGSSLAEWGNHLPFPRMPVRRGLSCLSPEPPSPHTC